MKNVFQYLDRFKGVDFLIEFYPTLHLQSIEDTVDDLIVMCKKMEGLWDDTLSRYQFTFKTHQIIMNQQQQQNFLIAYTIDRMTEFLIEDYELSIAAALQFIYNSETYQKLTLTDNGLYEQSPSYVYELLSQEYQTGVSA